MQCHRAPISACPLLPDSVGAVGRGGGGGGALGPDLVVGCMGCHSGLTGGPLPCSNVGRGVLNSSAVKPGGFGKSLIVRLCISPPPPVA